MLCRSQTYRLANIQPVRRREPPCAQVRELQLQKVQFVEAARPQPDHHAIGAPQQKADAGRAHQPLPGCQQKLAGGILDSQLASLAGAPDLAQRLVADMTAAMQCIAAVTKGAAVNSPVGELTHGVLVRIICANPI